MALTALTKRGLRAGYRQGFYWRKGDSDFVRHVLKTHKKIDAEEAAAKNPGARMVVYPGRPVNPGRRFPNYTVELSGLARNSGPVPIPGACCGRGEPKRGENRAVFWETRVSPGERDPAETLQASLPISA